MINQNLSISLELFDLLHYLILKLMLKWISSYNVVKCIAFLLWFLTNAINFCNVHLFSFVSAQQCTVLFTVYRDLSGNFFIMLPEFAMSRDKLNQCQDHS
jgi:hypothetical protein